MSRLLPLLALLPAVAVAQGGTLPVSAYTPDQYLQHISPTIGEGEPQNQPSIVNGYLLLAGNGHFELWDIADPFAPEHLSTFESPHAIGEAESHQVATRKTADGRWQVVTISGQGVDLWDLTDPVAPVLLAAIELEGINYGDNSEAVWGVAWQGDTVWVGGTNTGLHVIDASDPTSPTLLTRVPTSAFGGISAGPLWAVGDLLVVTTPKNHGGIVTLDISDPAEPTVLDFLVPAEDSYIGGFYGTRAHLVSPFRSYEVLADPTSIEKVGEFETPNTEYLTFTDGHAIVGRLRPNPGALDLDLSDLNTYNEVAYLEGRRDDIASGYFTDDQFTLPIGNLVVLGDDEIRYGAILVVRDLLPDSVPPRVDWIQPADGTSGVATTARIGVSLSDQIDLRSVTPDSLVVRPVLGGAPLTGDWDLTQTVLGFSPHAPLEPDTAYEVILPAGGVKDLSGNGLATEARAVFTTGDGSLPALCAIEPPEAVEVGATATLAALPAGDVTYRWDFGDGTTSQPSGDRTVQHAWTEPGRWPVTLFVEDDAGARSCGAVTVVHRELREVPAVSGPIATDGATAWVVNPDAGSLTAVDLAAATAGASAVLWEVPVGDDPRGVALAGNELLVVLRGEDALLRIDRDGAEVGRVELGYGALPWAVGVDGDQAWVSLEGAGALARVDLGTGEVERTELPADEGAPPSRPRGLALHPDGTVYASRFLSTPDAGRIHVVAPDGVEDIRLAIDAGPDTDSSGRGVPNLLANLALSPDGRRLAVPGTKANVERGLARDGELMNPQNTVRTLVSIVDLDAGAEATELRRDIDDHDSPWAAAWSPLGDLLFVASRGSNRVDVLDVDGARSVAAFSTGLAPTGVLVTGTTLLVHDSLDRTLSLLDVSGLLDATDSTARRLAVVPLVAEEPLSDELLLGKRIFTNASTREMSQDGYLSCATCHPDGGSDEVVWDFTDRGEGLRNTIDLRGRAGVGHGPVHWTGNFDEIQDFENDIRAHFGGSGFMDDADWALEGRSDPLGGAKAGVSPRLDALAAYVSSLDAFPRSPYREPDGSLTADGQKGRNLYETLNCSECHSGPALTDSSEGVRHDVGTITADSGQRIGGPLDGLDTPTLHGLHASAPYLHDGSAATIEETLRIEGHGDAQNLNDRRMGFLVSYLLQLDGTVPPTTEGCTCSSASPRGSWAWLLLPLLFWRRRR